MSVFFYLPFSVCLFWLVLFFVDFRKADPAKRFLTFFLLVCTILYFSHAVYFNRNAYLFSLIESIYTFCTLAVYPLYFLYICKLTDEKPLPVYRYWVLFPAFLVCILSVAFYSMMSESERISFVERYFYQHSMPAYSLSFAETGQLYRMRAMRVLFLVQLIPVCYFGLKKLIRFNAQIHNFYADTEEKTLAPIRVLLVLFILFSLFSAAANHVGRDFFVRTPWLVAIPSVIFSSMIFAVSYIGYQQRFTAVDFRKATEAASQEDVNYVDSPKEVLVERIRVLMEEQMLFLKKDLHISDVAKKAASNRTYVSNYINQELKFSFSDYINTYRVRYAQSLMTMPGSSLSLSEIGERSGFANEVSFYRNFKKIAGTTPAGWLKQQVPAKA
ncbi:MAG: helix-turn-helix domain-containing protein [Prolixibacteraceae bacterium]|nr:helix-turn-helix domain-containing protein [Prolixibacteraceae bacterium]